MSARGPAGAAALALGLGLLAGLAAAPAGAQDFASPRPAAASGVLAMLDGGTGPREPGVAFEAATTRWWNLPELQTHALAASFGRASVRAALGASQTGTSEFGWQSAAAAFGAAGPEHALAVRGLIRRDPGAVASERLGGEAGGGARLALGAALQLWASAPQLWTHGAAPPLRRPLSVGIAAEGEGASAWAALEGPRTGAAGERLIGVAMAAGGTRVWAEARGAPWRGAVGLESRIGPLGVAARVESHPELGETLQLALALHPRGARS